MRGWLPAREALHRGRPEARAATMKLCAPISKRLDLWLANSGVRQLALLCVNSHSDLYSVLSGPFGVAATPARKARPVVRPRELSYNVWVVVSAY